METLKPLEELCSPDERQQYFATFDRQSGELRQLALEDVYRKVAHVCLHEGVPEAVRSHFATVLNLVAYSWYFYPFNVTAQLMAYVSVEFALRKRYPESTKSPFKKLVARAVSEGLVRDSGFTLNKSQEFSPADLKEEAAPPEPSAEAYSNALVESMPYLRNNLAHGASTLHMNGAGSVRVCAEFINQLFERTQE